MKTLIASALLAGFAATAAAQEIIPFDDHFISTKTRAEVQAEVAQAARSGELYRQQGELTYSPTFNAAGPVHSRAQVRAEVARAAATGDLYRQQGEITWMGPATGAYGMSGSPSRDEAESGARAATVARAP
jgi:hypothetical protein